jgi:hypothetical protein
VVVVGAKVVVVEEVVVGANVVVVEEVDVMGNRVVGGTVGSAAVFVRAVCACDTT